MVGKKGSSHVEIIISFVIFIGFLLFFYAIISPAITGPKSDDTVLEDAKIEILKYIEAEVGEYDLKINERDDSVDCIKIVNPENKDMSVIKGEVILESFYEIGIKPDDSSETHFLIIKKPEDFEDIKLYFSEEFSNGDYAPCSRVDPLPECNSVPDVSGARKNCYLDCDTEDKKDSCYVDCETTFKDKSCYSKNFKKKRDWIFESKINDLKEAYTESPESKKTLLRTVLKIPEKYDFWFDFLEETGTNSKFGTDWEEISLDSESENIYADEIAISYIDATQDPENKAQGSLKIRLWG